jgi:hypothetical protein
MTEMPLERLPELMTDVIFDAAPSMLIPLPPLLEVVDDLIEKALPNTMMPSLLFAEALDDATEIESSSRSNPKTLFPEAATLTIERWSTTPLARRPVPNPRSTPFLTVTLLARTHTPLSTAPPSPVSVCPFRSIVTFGALTVIPPPAQARSCVSTAFVVTLCPQDVIGVPPLLFASGATVTSAAAATAASTNRYTVILPLPTVVTESGSYSARRSLPDLAEPEPAEQATNGVGRP